MKAVELQQVDALVETLTQKGVVALDYCDTEQTFVDIEHFQLMKEGDEKDPWCFSSKSIPINSEVAKDLFHRYLFGNDVRIYPLSLLD